jgi:NAD(P)-dependent dehydrogenase (short-subunit alcohol dehydrogenase family)
MLTIAVSGANRGLGLEFARQYAQEGARVFAGARHPEKAHDLNRFAAQSDGRLAVYALDVAHDASVEAFAANVGTAPIDVVIANAGYFGGDRQHRLDDVDYEEFLYTLSVNAVGALRFGGALAANLQRAKGKFIAVTSGMGSIAEDGSGYLAYRASKAALNMIMRTLAHDLAGAGVICLPMSPGWARTDMGGPEAPQDPADTVAAMRARIAELTPADSGRFLNWKGEERPW